VINFVEYCTSKPTNDRTKSGPNCLHNNQAGFPTFPVVLIFPLNFMILSFLSCNSGEGWNATCDRPGQLHYSDWLESRISFLLGKLASDIFI